MSSLAARSTLASKPDPVPSSLFVNGWFPRRRLLALALGLLAGAILAWLWNAHLVDQQIGFNSADAMLGRNANATPLGGVLSGVLFAFATGLAGSFTACNIAAFGAVGSLVGQVPDRRARFKQALRPIGWLAAGMVPVSAIYGAVVGIAGTHMPQFSSTPARPGTLSAGSIQSMTAFGVVGLAMIVFGLAALGLVRDPLAAVSRRHPNTPMVVLGVLIGGFLIGRPYPLFRDLFRSAARSHDPLYGAAAFVLQSAGNIAVMAVLFLVLAGAPGRRLRRWLGTNPVRITLLTAVSFLAAGAFAVLYWDVRALSNIGVLWFPHSPWH